MATNLEKFREIPPSEFLHLKGIEYFHFEEDFMENNIRCIPMIIRFKMDRSGIKLKLSQWRRFSQEERILLAKLKCDTNGEVEQYGKYLKGLIKQHTGQDPTILELDISPSWSHTCSLPDVLTQKLAEFNWQLSVKQWGRLTNLQRFALLKLCRPGHENKNFPKAVREFNLFA